MIRACKSLGGSPEEDPRPIPQMLLVRLRRCKVLCDLCCLCIDVPHTGLITYRFIYLFLCFLRKKFIFFNEKISNIFLKLRHFVFPFESVENWCSALHNNYFLKLSIISNNISSYEK